MFTDFHRPEGAQVGLEIVKIMKKCIFFVFIQIFLVKNHIFSFKCNSKTFNFMIIYFPILAVREHP